MYGITIYISDELAGITGDNGETICVFLTHPKNPLACLWTWFFDLDQAENFINDVKILEITLN